MEDSLHYLIMANRMLVQRGLLERLKNTGLTIGQPKVLDYLKDHDGSSQKEIARNCFLEAGSLTSILNRMEEKGLIERRMLNGNRRTFHIYLTKEGWKSQKLVEESFLEIEKQALKGITEEEFDAYLTFSRKIFKNLMLTEEEGTKMNKLKDIFYFGGIVYQCTWCKSDHKGKSWNIPDLFDSVCIKP